MKKILLSIFTTLLFTGCYEDKGSYDYDFDNMNDILLDSITFTPKAYTGASGTMIEIQQPMEGDTTLRVNVHLKQTIDTTYQHLDFAWIRNYNGKDSLGFDKQILDTMNTKGYVDLYFEEGVARTYSIRMIITDTKTTLKYYKSLTVKTRPIFKNSIFVLHGDAGERKLGNIELIGDIPNITIDAYKKVNPDKTNNPFAKGEYMHFTSGYQTGTSSGFYRTLCMFFNDGTGGKVWDPYGLKPKYAGNTNYVFKGNDKKIKIKQILGLGNPDNLNSRKIIIDQNGRYYVAGDFYAYIPYNNLLADNAIGQQTDFNIATGTIMGNYYIFWDNKNNRFLYQLRNADLNRVPNGEADARTVANKTAMTPLLDAHVDFSSLSAEFSPVGKRAVYAYVYSWENDYNRSHAFFIFADTIGSSEGKQPTYYHYELTQKLGDKDSESRKKINASIKAEEPTVSIEPAFAIAARKLPSMNPGDFATNICYSYCYSTNYVFFIDASAKTVYRYNISNNELYTVYEAPSGYDITQIKFRTEYYSNFQQDLGRYIGITLYNGKNGAVAEVKLDNTGDIDPSFKVNLYEGDGNEKFGKINDIQYVHDMVND